MTARTFGRKGMVAAAGIPRAAFPARDPDQFEAIEIDEAALRRAAFVAEERARSEEKVQAERPAALPAALPLPEPPAPTDKSLTTAYALWLCLGLAGGHRFYLRRPLTGAIQTLLFLGCWGAALAEYYAAFGGLALSCLWMLVDGFLIRRLHAGSGPR
jgi:TM2 domain-containing membrane protein YozV